LAAVTTPNQNKKLREAALQSLFFSPFCNKAMHKEEKGGAITFYQAPYFLKYLLAA
jgi:hypothetical protein